MKTTMDRRQFLKYTGAGLAGLGLSALNLPFFRMGKASAALGRDAWCFGVMGDTQWKTGFWETGGHMSCATGIIDAINQQFIAHGCKFVIQVGDLVGDESYMGKRCLPTRAEHARALYREGIGFFPLRGNHESSSTAASEFPDIFPQTLGKGRNLNGAAHFQASDNEQLKGLTYAFDYNNVRCVMLDQFVRKDGSNHNRPDSAGHKYANNMVDQVDWTDKILSATPDGYHSFVFSHKNLIGQNHKDNLFGDSLTSNAHARDKFLESLHSNGTGYYISGHDHMHHRSIVSSSDGSARVPQIITASNSYKFYTPRTGDDKRETPLGQELYTIGYYIVTIEGPRVTVDFYSSSHGRKFTWVQRQSLDSIPSSFAFFLRERFGYSLNGRQFEIPREGSYIDVTDSYRGTTAKILAGTNQDTKTDYLNRNLTKTVNTGWADPHRVGDAVSDIFTLWGMTDNLSLYSGSGLLPASDRVQVTDEYVLSMSCGSQKTSAFELSSGKIGIAARNKDNEWVNAVKLNHGGTTSFKKGPYKSGYGLGTYGVDPGTMTVWAVINHEGDFVAKLI